MIRAGFDALALSFGRGGITHYQLRLMEALRARPGIRVELTGSPIPLFGQATLGYAANWARCLLARPDPDIHHITGLSQAPGFRAKRTVMTVHDMIPETIADRFPDLRGLHRQKLVMAKAADAVIAFGAATRDALVEIGHLPPEKVTIVPHGGAGIDERLLTGTPGKPPVSKPYLLFVGPRRTYKGFDVVLRPLCRVLRGRDDLDVVCAGGGDFTAQERDALSAYQLHERFHFIKPDDAELAAAYRGATLYISPALADGFGTTLIEAMRAGTPVLATDIQVFREAAGDAAAYFEPGSEDAFEAALPALLDDSDRRVSLAKAGAARAATYGWAATAEGTEAVYRRVLGL
jgi:glycosyltransferase involved in cell wall biosynthesis